MDFGEELNQKGLKSFKSLNYKEALEYFSGAIDNKNKNALTNLGYMYENGYGVKRNLQKAIQLYEQAIEYNDKPAIKRLSNIYSLGVDNIENNEKRVIELCEKAILLGDTDSIFTLAKIYQNGEGVKENKEIANDLYQYVMNANILMDSLTLANSFFLKGFYHVSYIFYKLSKSSSTSYYFLSLFYEKGFHVNQDKDKSQEYYKIFIEKADLLDYKNVKNLMKAFKGLNKDELSQEILKIDYLIEVEEVYLDLKTKLLNTFEKNNFFQDENLNKKIEEETTKFIKDIEKVSNFSLEGLKFLKNSNNIIEENILKIILQKLTTNSYQLSINNEDFQRLINSLIRKCIPILDLKILLLKYQIAKHYFTLGSENEDYISMNNLGFIYEYGLGVEKNLKKAIELYEKSSKFNSNAFLNLGFIYQKHNDFEKARNYYEKGVQQENLDCANFLGMLYMKEFEYGSAEKCFQIGISKNHQGCKLNLGSLYYLKKKYKNALNLFQELDKEGNLEGTYNLAILNFEGKGVERNYIESNRLFQKVKEIKPKEVDFYYNLMKEYLKVHEETVQKQKELMNVYNDSYIESLNFNVIGESFQKLKIGEMFGLDNYSVFHKGYFQNMNVILKIYNKDSFVELLLNKGIIFKLEHPNIIKSFGWSEHHNRVYFILEYMEDILLNRIKSLNREKKHLVLLNVANGMNFLHKLGIIHNNLTCRGILLKGDTAKVSDLTLAFFRSEVPFKPKERPTNYLAPESVKNNIFNEKTDVYSFAMIIYSLFELHEPDAPQNESSRPIIETLKDLVNLDIKLLMFQCWDQDPEKRPDFEKIIERIKEISLNEKQIFKDFLLN